MNQFLQKPLRNWSIKHVSTPQCSSPLNLHTSNCVCCPPLQDVQFVAAMGPPGGGRNAVTNRYLRHFSVVSVTAFDTDNLT